MTDHPPAGFHFIAELSGCPAHLLNDLEGIKAAMIDGATRAKATVLGSNFHKFEPAGVSGLVFLAESHFSIHTWPELGYAAIDAFTCGSHTMPEQACTYLADSLQAERRFITGLERGIEYDKQFVHKLDRNNLNEIIVNTKRPTNFKGKAKSISHKYLLDDYTAFAITDCVHAAKSLHHDVRVVHTNSYGLALYVDGTIQSSEYDEYIYHEATVHPVMANLAKAERVLIIGGCEGASAREVLRYPQVKQVDMVNSDKVLVDICREHLPLWHQDCFQDPRLKLHYQDPWQFLRTCRNKYDFIILDLVNTVEANSPVRKFYRGEFFASLAARLSPEGAMVIQASELSAAEFDNFGEIYRQVLHLTKHCEVYSGFVPSFTSEWGFILCNNHKSFAALEPEQVDFSLDSKLGSRTSQLEFYDGLAHKKMFIQSKDLRELVKNSFVDEEQRQMSIRSLYNFSSPAALPSQS